MSDCSEIRAHLPLFAGGELETPLAAAVERHLGVGTAERGAFPEGAPTSLRAELQAVRGGCAACRGEFERLLRARAALLALGAVTRSRALSKSVAELDLWPGIRAALLEEGRIQAPAAQPMSEAAVASALPSAPPTALRPRFARSNWVGRLASAAAAVALLAGAWSAWGPGHGPRSADFEHDRPRFADQGNGPSGFVQGVPSAFDSGSTTLEPVTTPPRLAMRAPEAFGAPGVPALGDANVTPVGLHAPAVAIRSSDDSAECGGLRPLLPGERPLSREALPFSEGRRGWMPAALVLRRPSPDSGLAPKLASDRSPR